MYWPMLLNFTFNTTPSDEYSWLNFFRIDWFALLAVQEIQKGLFHHHNWKASVFWHSAFFMVQLSCLYVTAGKIIGLTIWTFVSKVISLLFNMLSRFVITFLSRSKCLLISRLHSLTLGVQYTLLPLFPILFAMKYWDWMPWSYLLIYFLMLSFTPAFSLSSFTSSGGYLVPLHFLPLEWCHLHF